MLCKKRILSLLLTCVITGCLWLPCAAEGEGAAVVSHGLAVLSARTDVAVSAMVGNDVVFSEDVFARGLNLSRVEYITVVSLPSITDGELLMGSVKLVEGQTVTASAMKDMVFRPAVESEMRAGFQFTANGSATPMICTVYLLDEVNYTPTVSMASGLSLNVQTHKGLSAYGTLSAYDPDGDELIFEIVSYPKNGTLQLTDVNRGSYVYRPNESYVGRDSFTYVARDRYGNYSASATVSLTVDYSGTSITYADMEASKSYNAAITVTEKGIMSGELVGASYYFYPNETVSRVEFLVMAMNAAGIREVPDCIATSFADDGDIPQTMKGYVAVAHSMGIISGSVNENGETCFLPNEPLTRAHAAVILKNLLEPEEKPTLSVFEDHSSIPVWAADAIYTLNAAGILTSWDGCIDPASAVSRAQTAEMLAAVMSYLEQ